MQEGKELTVREYKRLFSTALREGKEQLAICMETIVSTGIRISELVFFTVEAVKKECIEITNKGKYRRIFLPKQLKKKLLLFAKKQGVKQGPFLLLKMENQRAAAIFGER